MQIRATNQNQDLKINKKKPQKKPNNKKTGEGTYMRLIKETEYQEGKKFKTLRVGKIMTKQ